MMLDSFRIVEVWLSQGYSLKDILRKLRLLKGVVKQLDGRTVGLVAYNDWNTKPESCWCGRAPENCKTCYIPNHWGNSPFEKWMSIAHDFDGVDVVVQVEVSDIAFYGFAVNGEVIWHELILDCDQLPEAVIEEIEKLEAIVNENS